MMFLAFVGFQEVKQTFFQAKNIIYSRLDVQETILDKIDKIGFCGFFFIIPPPRFWSSVSRLVSRSVTRGASQTSRGSFSATIGSYNENWVCRTIYYLCTFDCAAQNLYTAPSGLYTAIYMKRTFFDSYLFEYFL